MLTRSFQLYSEYTGNEVHMDEKFGTLHVSEFYSVCFRCYKRLICMLHLFVFYFYNVFRDLDKKKNFASGTATYRTETTK